MTSSASVDTKRRLRVIAGLGIIVVGRDGLGIDSVARYDGEFVWPFGPPHDLLARYAEVYRPRNPPGTPSP